MDSTVLISDLKILVSNTKFAQCKNCPDRLEDSRKGEETADSLSNRVFDREPHYDRDARQDQTRPDTPPLLPMISIVGIRTHDHMKPQQ